MATVIGSVIPEHNFFQSTAHRTRSLFRPIQETNYKSSDFLGYAATPLIDAFILEPVFAIDAAIHLLNATASLCKALYNWTQYQQDSDDLVDYHTNHEMKAASRHTVSALSAIVAQSLNTILSIIALVTRPIASLVHAISGNSDSNHERSEHYFGEEATGYTY